MSEIKSFSGEYEFLSNFYMCPVKYTTRIYPSSEHAFQAAKTFDEKARERICNLATPGQAKRAGRKVKLRDDWEDVKVLMMATILVDKFDRNPELIEKLLATGDAELIEGNNWGDKFWGVCGGEGENQLGRCLMALRVVYKLIRK